MMLHFEQSEESVKITAPSRCFRPSDFVPAFRNFLRCPRTCSRRSQNRPKNFRCNEKYGFRSDVKCENCAKNVIRALSSSCRLRDSGKAVNLRFFALRFPVLIFYFCQNLGFAALQFYEYSARQPKEKESNMRKI